ncbi:MAG: 4-hydroxy-tetrahydrodipicolinate synthase [Flavobacteriales bacterium]|jgi:4-hydroxy-tetrahydrodipicolinate synthase|uniref:4-hydroxy-tetrahydrodipicolinate synthase n=1 Tax=Blattabacterium sp. (Mastotermes darwiniensis) TaxID=39768 RepID=UPI000231DE8C|nr:4-hydroxy-tetrahydrodipicolinate synthase [Blattabacterium sp. (Mastotermes darwiniensis)]AER40704.1 dihydrodipicolinate synthase [Blattabacterium sp. (Mastotermes darwiniensis) str. MADAR]MDR1804768.1 4-hydroxy-tetrahydrodipicolinate synthase [Flavobacteriales bacterium]
MKKLYGTGVALVTPFKKNGNIDFNGLEKLVKYVGNKVEYLVILGTTAETSTLKEEEKRDIIECIKSFNYKKRPLVLGIGGNNTEDIIAKIKSIDLSDFLAILTVTPYYNNPSQEGIYQHFKSIVRQTNVNIIVYNVPKRTGSNVLPETVIRLAKNFQNIVGIKEASGNILQSYKIIEKRPNNFSVISGDDFISLPIILGGGEGVISVIAQGIPDSISRMISLARKKKSEEAFAIFYEIFSMIDLLYREGNPTGIKTFLNLIGICNSYVRLPLLSGSSSLRNKIRYLLRTNRITKF